MKKISKDIIKMRKNTNRIQSKTKSSTRANRSIHFGILARTKESRGNVMNKQKTQRDLLIEEIANLLIEIDEGDRPNPLDKERLYYLQTKYPETSREARKLVKQYYRERSQGIYNG